MAGADRTDDVTDTDAADATPAPGYALVERASGGVLPDTGVLTRTVIKEPGARVTWFGLVPGEELSEHSSTRPALLHFLRGRARLTLGGDTVDVGPGDYLHMDADLRHSVRALEPLEFMLTLLAPA